jgi:hypothetical protein
MIDVFEIRWIEIGQHEWSTMSCTGTENNVPHDLLGDLLAKEPRKTIILQGEVRETTDKSAKHSL